MKTQAKYSYRNPKVWCVQPPTERRPTLCNDLYNHDQCNPYNNPYNDPYDNDLYNDPHKHDPYNDPYNNLYDNPYNNSTDDLSDNPCHDSYRTLYTNAYNDLHDNKDINPSILALLEAKFDLDIENFFASLTMTPATSIPNFVTVFEVDNPENSNPNTPADTANCDTNPNCCNHVDYHYPTYNDAANALHATLDSAHCLLLTVLLSSSHPRMNNLVLLLPSNHESPLPPPEPPPPGPSNIVFAQPANCHDTAVQVQPRLSLHSH